MALQKFLVSVRVGCVYLPVPKYMLQVHVGNWSNRLRATSTVWQLLEKSVIIKHLIGKKLQFLLSVKRSYATFFLHFAKTRNSIHFLRKSNKPHSDTLLLVSFGKTIIFSWMFFFFTDLIRALAAEITVASSVVSLLFPDLQRPINPS